MGALAEHAAACALPPDHFAGDKASRSWFGAAVTVAGLAATLYQFNGSFQLMLANPLSTEVSLAPFGATARPMTLVCASAVGCSISHVYEDAACKAAVAAAGAPAAAVTLANGKTLDVQICGSPLWGDGVRVALPLGALTGLTTSPLAYLNADLQQVNFPRAPFSTPALAEPTSALEFGLVVATNKAAKASNAAVARHWAAGSPYPSSTPCSSGAIAPLGVPELGTLCYLIKAAPTVTIMVTRKSFSLLSLLAAWGGAYSFVFGLIGYGLYWIGGLALGLGAAKGDAAASAAQQLRHADLSTNLRTAADESQASHL